MARDDTQRSLLGSVWEKVEGDGCLVATSIHSGHEVRSEIANLLALDDATRLREEDPYTDRWIDIAPSHLRVLRSRFEIDLNRPRDRAVYQSPADAWGLQLWRSKPPASLVEASLAEYDRFYAEMSDLLDRLVAQHERVVVYDLHSYNHRRDGRDAPPEDPARNPEVNLGTRTMNRSQWGHVVDRFLADLRGFDFLGRTLDVRENVKFFGGHLGKFIHERYPASVCVLSVETKKIYMDEWSGVPDSTVVEAFRRALESTVPGVLEALRSP